MTMPHLQNCDHNEHGWCPDCVKKLWEECDQAKDQLKNEPKYQHNIDELKSVAALLDALHSFPDKDLQLSLDGTIEVWWADSLMGTIEHYGEGFWYYHPVPFGAKDIKETVR